MGKGGRPSSYSLDLAARFCQQIGEGKTLRAVCNTNGMPDWHTIHRWLDKHEEFRMQYTRARDLCMQAWEHKLVEIAHDESRDLQPDGKGGFRSDNTAVNRDRLKIDSYKWLMSKMAPKKYGDLTKLEVGGVDGVPLVIEYKPK